MSNKSEKMPDSNKVEAKSITSTEELANRMSEFGGMLKGVTDDRAEKVLTNPEVVARMDAITKYLGEHYADFYPDYHELEDLE